MNFRSLIAVFRIDQHISDLAGCAVKFDADLSALRDTVLQFGSVTTSRIQFAGDEDMMNWQQMPCRCCHSLAAQVLPLFQLLSIFLSAAVALWLLILTASGCAVACG